ncbi:alpha/beta hydrolase [Phanerochaete sordida]|uniref:Alpha/beta hydrolase n=1 Tax=Phanerochaete sordida TaxID=48140 RepID=A0A9P3GBZ2_9APHY|nr:alpha/beta hydrolase [Phanerochaete sordida]
MPLAQIDEQGITLYYEDSGPPPAVQFYTTLILVHGLVINSATFEHLLPLASRYGLRIITVNSRDYAGSTPYTDEELPDLANPDTNIQAVAVRRWGTETARFVRFACETLGLHATANGAGGVVLVTWSMSGIAALSILGDSRTMDQDLGASLAPYLRKVVLYDPPALVFGTNPGPGFIFPFNDPTIPVDKRAEAFGTWASSWYDPVFALADITLEALRARTAPLPATPTLSKLSPEGLARTIDPSVAGRSARIMDTTDEIRQAHARCAFMDADAVLPDVDVLSLWCDSSKWSNVWGAKVIDGFVRAAPERGKRKRNMSHVKIENANHFVHWEDPERLLRIIVQFCGSNVVASAEPSRL